MSWIRKNALWRALTGTVAMALAIWGTRQGVRYTSTAEFCLPCYSIRTAGKEYKASVHFRDTPDTWAECKGCHIPPGVIPTLVHKIEVLNDLYHTFISSSIDTPEKFAAKHPELTQREWARMSVNNSAACKFCHSYKAMDHGRRSVNTAVQMAAAAARDSNCIDYHKGIARHRPGMGSGFRDRYEQLQRQGGTPTDTTTQLSLSEKSLAAAAGNPVGKVPLFPATEVKAPKRENSNVQLETMG